MPFVSSYAQQVLTGHINSSTTIALFNSAGDELTAIGGYTRKAIGEIDTSKPSQIANKDIIFLFEATGTNSDTATNFGLYKGNSKVFEGSISSLTISPGYVPLIRAHNLIIGLDVASLDEDY